MAEPDFNALKRRANGMLPAETYAEIYKVARGVTEGDALEVGTAHGAATIALASGLQSGKVITIDKIEGGSRDQFGDLETNKNIIEGNFKNFAVAEKIDFRIGASKDVAQRLPTDLKIGLLMLDADGAIDRDFLLFYDRIAPGAPIIIDDYKPGFIRFSFEGRNINMEQKRRITALLVDYFAKQGYLENGRAVGETWFGRKPLNAPSIKDVNLGEIQDLYRKLIFGSGPSHNRAAELLGRATRKFPGLHTALKKIYLKN